MFAWISSLAHNALIVDFSHAACPLGRLLSDLTGSNLGWFMCRLRIVSGAHGRCHNM